MRIKVREIREWLKSLDENKWRKVYNVDARRIAHFVKNEMKKEEIPLPESLKRRAEGHEYGREKALAKRYVEAYKKRNNIHESIRKIIREEIKLFKEEDNAYQKFFKKTLEKFDVKSPNELDDAKKKEFFNYIDKNWDAKKETD